MWCRDCSSAGRPRRRTPSGSPRKCTRPRAFSRRLRAKTHGRCRRRGACRARCSRPSMLPASATCCAISCAVRGSACRARTRSTSFAPALLTSHGESHPLVRWVGGEGRVFRQNLHLLAALPSASARDYSARASARRLVGARRRRGVRARVRLGRSARVVGRSRVDAALSRRRRAIPAARPRPSSAP